MNLNLLKLKKIPELIARIKIYFNYSGVYLAIGNFFMILSTFKVVNNIDISILILAPIGFTILCIIGYTDFKYVARHQHRHQNTKNNIKHQLDILEQKLNKILENEKKA